MSKKAADRALRAARERGLKEALEQERLALTAIVKVMLLEVDDPSRVLARLDAMARAAEGNRRVPPATRRALIDGARFVRRAVERERTGQQTTLLDPAKPEPRPATVDAIVDGSEGPSQMGLVSNESLLGDAREAHDDRVETLATIHAALVDVLRDHGAATDRELHDRYAIRALTGSERLPRQTTTAIKERRRELTAAGRLVRVEGRGEPVWDLIERPALEAAG